MNLNFSSYSEAVQKVLAKCEARLLSSGSTSAYNDEWFDAIFRNENLSFVPQLKRAADRAGKLPNFAQTAGFDHRPIHTRKSIHFPALQ